jgi:hypothetical protein
MNLDVLETDLAVVALERNATIMGLGEQRHGSKFAFG